MSEGGHRLSRLASGRKRFPIVSWRCAIVLLKNILLENRGQIVQSPNKIYVQTDEHGIMRVGKTRVSLDSVVAAFDQGHSAETIVQRYPALTLEEVYGAITYSLANRETVAEYLERQREVWRALKEKIDAQPSPVVERLRKIAQSKAGAE